MTFEEILATTMFSTKETTEKLMPVFINTGEYERLQERYLNEIKKLQEKYPIITDATAIETMRKELSDYARKLILTIKNDYPNLIPNERLEKLDQLLDSSNIKIINDPNDNHDFSANSVTGELIINLHNLKGNNIYEKIVTAKGTLPHEIFHFLIKMLKEEDKVDERLVINIKDREPLTSKGMAGFMLSEGFVEKFSKDFCKKHEALGEDFYFSPGPQTIPYIEICEYIMSKNPNININNIFTLNYEDCLNSLTEEERRQYKKIEPISYAVRHNVKKEDIISAYTEKIFKDNMEISLTELSKEQLLELKTSILTEEQQKELEEFLQSEHKIL